MEAEKHPQKAFWLQLLESGAFPMDEQQLLSILDSENSTESRRGRWQGVTLFDSSVFGIFAGMCLK